MQFSELMKLFDDPALVLSTELYDAIQKLLERKAVTEEKDLNPQMPVIRDFIETECERQKAISDETADDHKHDYDALNAVFRKTLGFDVHR